MNGVQRCEVLGAREGVAYLARAGETCQLSASHPVWALTPTSACS